MQKEDWCIEMKWSGRNEWIVVEWAMKDALANGARKKPRKKDAAEAVKNNLV